MSYFREKRRIDKIIDAVVKELEDYVSTLHKDVQIWHSDGSYFFFCSASIIEYYDKDHGAEDELGVYGHLGEWIIVLTEHHGYVYYPKDDLDDWKELECIGTEKHPSMELSPRIKREAEEDAELGA